MASRLPWALIAVISSKRRSSAQALALRSRIVLGCAEGLSNEVAARERVAQPTVGKWRRRFVEGRCDGLVDDPRPGRPVSVTAEQVEDVVVATLESAPANATHWSRISMAERCGLSKSTIGRIWKAFELQPHRSEDFKLSNDPLFAEKVYDIVGLYLDPPEAAVVLCVDEKSQIQALARSQPAFPMTRHARETPPRLRALGHHQPVRRLRHQRRHRHHRPAPAPPRHRVPQVPHHHRRPGPRPPRHPPDLRQLRTTMRPPCKAGWPNSRASTCTTPPPIPAGSTRSSGGSPELTRQLIQRGDHRSVQALEHDIRAWAAAWNDNPNPFVWTKTAEQILRSIQGLMKRINGAGH